MDWQDKVYDIHGIVSRLEVDMKAIKDQCPVCQNRITILEKSNNIKYGMFITISVLSSLIVTLLAAFIQAGKLF